MRTAFEVFAQELDAHLKYFQETLTALDAAATTEQYADIFAARARKLEHLFHVIKGASGFLQLKEIREMSIKGESWFKNQTVGPSDKSALLKDFRELITGLQSESNTLNEVLDSTREKKDA